MANENVNKAKSNSLLILGNGFNKECDLSSSFSEFLTKQTKEEKESDNVYSLLRNIEIDDSRVGSLVDPLSEESKHRKNELLNSINDMYTSLNQNYYNFWILYLDTLQKDNKLPNNPLWSDVEWQIAYLCNQIYNYSVSDKKFVNIYDNYVSFIRIFSKYLNNHKSTVNISSPSAPNRAVDCIQAFLYRHPGIYSRFQHKANNSLCIAIIIAMVLCGLNWKINYTNNRSEIINYTQYFYNFLFNQLHMFDKKFTKYLNHNIENVDKQFVYGYHNLREKGLHLLCGTNKPYNLITFNYTGNPKNDKNNHNCKKYLPIHSDLKHNPIIGIGDDICRDSKGNDKGFFEFSKVAQILSVNSKEPTIANMVSNVDCIKFYGHSLASADYPYFKYIFDECDLKHRNDIELVFYYSNYNGKDEDFNNKMKQVKRVYRLLDRYDKNLRMKLILERRVKIICIPGWENKEKKNTTDKNS